jgi:hypothetical protein
VSDTLVANKPIRSKDVSCLEDNRDVQVTTSPKSGMALFNFVEGKHYGKTVEISMKTVFEAIECVRAATPPSGAPIGHRRPSQAEMEQPWNLEPHRDVSFIVLILPDQASRPTVRCTVSISDLMGAVTFAVTGIGEDQSHKDTVAAKH